MVDYQSTSVPRNSSLAIVSLVSGIAAWVILPIIGGIIAIITGHMAKREINESSGEITGNGMATAGLVLGYLQIGLTCAAVCAITLIALFLVPSSIEIN
jgi:hypothetical protein